ncbi:MAG: COP23 domain-containing protein [Pleurocapsa sp. MO_226.B13]|nr:COP23 domain-containing protein [Pleurocapsa sp. MO_226.B13]
MFACEENNGILITVARNSEGKTQTLFHWKEEALNNIEQSSTELCHHTSNKLNEFSTDGHDMSTFDLIAENFGATSAIYVTTGIIRNECSKVLFTIKEQFTMAQNTLHTILNPEIIKLTKEKTRKNERLFVYTGDRVDFLELFNND